MLKIRTEVRPSQIEGAGMGVYCIDFVPAGSIVWAFDEGFDLRVPALPTDPIAREFVETYGYLQADGTPGYVICVDNARFFNHLPADKATCRVSPDGATFATRDLDPGTELTTDYDTFCADDLATGYLVGDGAFPRSGGRVTAVPPTGRTFVHFGRSMLFEFGHNLMARNTLSPVIRPGASSSHQLVCKERYVTDMQDFITSIGCFWLWLILAAVCSQDADPCLARARMPWIKRGLPDWFGCLIAIIPLATLWTVLLLAIGPRP